MKYISKRNIPMAALPKVKVFVPKPNVFAVTFAKKFNHISKVIKVN